MIKIIRLCFFSVIIMCTSCSINIYNLFIDNVSGVYARYESTDVITVDNFGSIYVNNVLNFRLYQVLSPNTAIYKVVNYNNSNGFLPVLYRTDILYIGQIVDQTDEVDFSTVEFFGLKTI